MSDFVARPIVELIILWIWSEGAQFRMQLPCADGAVGADDIDENSYNCLLIVVIIYLRQQLAMTVSPGIARR